MRIWLAFWVLAWACLQSGAVVAETGKDHPMISRVPGSEILQYSEKAFDEFELPLGPTLDTDKYVKSKHLEGKVTRLKYSTPEERSTLELQRSYEQALQKAGFKTLFSCAGPACFASTYSHGYSTAISGVWCTNCAEPMRYLAAVLKRDEGDVYVSLVVEKDKYEGGTWLTVVEVKPMESGLVKVKPAETMNTDLGSTGHSPIYGVYFDTGKAVVKAESAPTLAEIVKLLTANPDMKLHVVGHTDNVGTLAANMVLSKQRAAAVVTVLTTEHGIARARLDSAGVGSLSPVTSNRTEAGRAKNRRVELVEQ
jgi:outer membrane protein OmpA-like peptidoglycan-associated protein